MDFATNGELSCLVNKVKSLKQDIIKFRLVVIDEIDFLHTESLYQISKKERKGNS